MGLPWVAGGCPPLRDTTLWVIRESSATFSRSSWVPNIRPNYWPMSRSQVVYGPPVGHPWVTGIHRLSIRQPARANEAAMDHPWVDCPWWSMIWWHGSAVVAHDVGLLDLDCTHKVFVVAHGPLMVDPNCWPNGGSPVGHK